MASDAMNLGGRDAADLMTEASRAAAGHAVALTRAAAQVGQGSALTIARAVYTGAYFISYGVVFPVVFGVRALPRENATMRGLSDGKRAALDALDAAGRGAKGP